MRRMYSWVAKEKTWYFLHAKLHTFRRISRIQNVDSISTSSTHKRTLQATGLRDSSIHRYRKVEMPNKIFLLHFAPSPRLIQSQLLWLCIQWIQNLFTLKAVPATPNPYLSTGTTGGRKNQQRNSSCVYSFAKQARKAAIISQKLLRKHSNNTITIFISTLELSHTGSLAHTENTDIYNIFWQLSWPLGGREWFLFPSYRQIHFPHLNAGIELSSTDTAHCWCGALNCPAGIHA